VLIRDAGEGDWPEIYQIFTGVVDEGRTYAYPEGLGSAEAKALWLLTPPGRTVVAFEDDEVLGTATMGPNRPGRGSHIATAGFMVGPAARGRGVGRALGEHMLSWAKEQGYLGVQFNAVVETNDAAVRLWQSLGFEIVGTVPGAFRHPDRGFVGLHVMFRPV
jgi:L-amino acid N-acyltransferase YncA